MAIFVTKCAILSHFGIGTILRHNLTAYAVRTSVYRGVAKGGVGTLD
jgi:hypothetical protein